MTRYYKTLVFYLFLNNQILQIYIKKVGQCATVSHVPVYFSKCIFHYWVTLYMPEYI